MIGLSGAAGGVGATGATGAAGATGATGADGASVSAGTAVTYPLAAPYTTLAATDHVLVSNLQGPGTYAVSASADLSNTTGGPATLTLSIWVGGVAQTGADITLPDGGVDNLSVPMVAFTLTTSELVEFHILTVTAGVNVEAACLLGPGTVGTALTIWEPGVGPAGATGAAGGALPPAENATLGATVDLPASWSTWTDVLALTLAAGTWWIAADVNLRIDGGNGYILVRLTDGTTVYGGGQGGSGWYDASVSRTVKAALATGATITLQACTGYSGCHVTADTTDASIGNVATQINALQIA
jgi:hypothetical protein